MILSQGVVNILRSEVFRILAKKIKIANDKNYLEGRKALLFYLFGISSN